MTRKTLLIVSSSISGSHLDLYDELAGWEIRSVKHLASAVRELRRGDFTVGLLEYDRDLHRRADLDAFLRQRCRMLWIGIFKPHDLESESCRDLIFEHLIDYHTAPVDSLRLAHTLGHAHGRAILERRNCISAGARLDAPLVGDSEPMQRLRSQIERVAKVAAPVLIWGESGTGKEMTAQAIHDQSERSSGPFVPINCGAISPTLVHSELFGYERGAFTGATCRQAGLIESANGGTLFLDEIGDLPKDMQANLLRFLQEKTICRLGSTRNIHVDVRVLAASHVQLQEAVARGDFREDLYYRLAVLPVAVPPLRARHDDLAALAEHFFQIYANERASGLRGFSRRAITAILDHDWPGNVRELINRVRRAMVMANGRLITPDDLGLTGIATATSDLDGIRISSERMALQDSLNSSGQNISLAARELGLSRSAMYRLLDKHGLRQHRGSRPNELARPFETSHPSSII